MGADPVGFLLGTPYGWGCLAAAVAFEVAGVFWMRRLVHGIEKKL
jgi:tight adherence protein B